MRFSGFCRCTEEAISEGLTVVLFVMMAQKHCPSPQTQHTHSHKSLDEIPLTVSRVHACKRENAKRNKIITLRKCTTKQSLFKTYPGVPGATKLIMELSPTAALPPVMFRL